MHPKKMEMHYKGKIKNTMSYNHAGRSIKLQACNAGRAGSYSLILDTICS